MTHDDWWKARDDADDRDRDWLDDFDFDAAASTAVGVGGLWSRWGAKAQKSTDDAVRVAQTLRMVQGFVDTFATGDKPYRVTFDESVKTAGTDFKAKAIVVSHAPLFDSTITVEEAEEVLTGMAAHESSHVRYDRRIVAAVEKAFPRDPRAQSVNNIISDKRIEVRFGDDYPGYRHVFAPTLRYVAESQLRAAGVERFAVDQLDAMGVVVGAIRYPAYIDWTGAEAERDWWQSWSDRWTRTDKTTDRVAAVAEALAHLDEPPPEPKGGCGVGGGTPVAGQGQGGGTPTDGPGGGQGTEAPAPDGGQESPNPVEVADNGDGTVTITLPECWADAVEAAAKANDRHATDLSAKAAQEKVENAKALVKYGTDELGDAYGEVYWGPGGVAHSRESITPDGSASASIRAAFARSRTGHFSTERNLRSGRVDNRSLSRIACQDFRLFNRRRAPSEGNYNVWLLADTSGSMGGMPVLDAAALGTALASASRSIPAMRLSIWAWTTAWKQTARFGAARVWTQGDPIANVGYLPRIRRGGTPDAEVLQWAAGAILADCRPGEKAVIILASDGQGSLEGSEAVDAIRRRGVAVVSVALGRLSPAYQEATFGAKGYIPWGGSIRAMARPLGNLLARVVSGGRLD